MVLGEGGAKQGRESQCRWLRGRGLAGGAKLRLKKKFCQEKLDEKQCSENNVRSVSRTSGLSCVNLSSSSFLSLCEFGSSAAIGLGASRIYVNKSM